MYARYYSLVQTRQRDIYCTWTTAGIPARNEQADHHTQDYKKYQLLLGCPWTGKTQVVKRLVHTLIEEEYSVTVCAPLGLLATNYREEFYPDLEADTIHALFNIPVAADQQYVVNYAIGKYDAIIIDEASKVADDTFHMIHDTLEKQVHRPLAIIAGDECQKVPPPLKTVNGRTIQTTSILKNRRLHEVCQIQSLDQQLRCTDEAYLDFLQHIRHSKPEQYVLDNFQRPLLLFNQSDLTDYDTWKTIEEAPNTTFLTVSGAVATRVNSIITRRMFQEKIPLSSIPLKNDVEEFLPFKHMRVVVTQNLDKSTVLSTASWLTLLTTKITPSFSNSRTATPRSLIQ